MLPESEIFETVRRWEPSKRLVYEIALPASLAVAGVLGAIIVGGLTTLIARAVVASDLGGDVLISSVILPSIMAYIFTMAGVTRVYYPDEHYFRIMGRAAWKGFTRGFFVGFVTTVVIHFLAQLLVARAIYGAIQYQSHVGYYCAPTPLLYGVLFALPVGLGAALLYGYLSIGPQIVFDRVRRLPESS